METIVFLEGRDYTDWEDNYNDLQKRGYDVSILDNLYDHPEKLSELPKMNPDYLFIGTTGMFTDKRDKLIEAFNKLKYIPKAVIFLNDTSAETYLSVARELKVLGTKFYLAPSIIFKDDKLKEITWI